MQISDKDKARLEELVPKNIFGQFIVLFGVLSIMAAFYEVLPFESRTPSWSDFFLLLIIGAVLICVGLLLAKPLRPRPRYWRTAISGAVSSGCFVLFLICLVIVARTPKEHIPEWLWGLVVLLIVVGIFAAITCIHSAIMDAIGTKLERSEDDKKPVA